MCDEADRDLESVADGSEERSSGISSNQPVPHFDLQLQRYEKFGLTEEVLFICRIHND